MSIITPPPAPPTPAKKKRRGNRIVRWRPRVPAMRGKGRLNRPLSKAGTVVALAAGGVTATIVLGGVIVAGVGALAIGAIAVTGYWFWARRKGIWAHVLVDTDDVVISLAVPIPISLLNLGLSLSPVPDDAADMARLILSDPELLKTLHKDAIEIVVDSGTDHIEVVIGPRRKKWRAIQFNPIRSFSQTPSLPEQEDTNHVR